VWQNCFWDGHGAEEVDTPFGSDVAGVHTPLACQAACLTVPACEAILFTPNDGGHCYRKRQVTFAAYTLDATVCDSWYWCGLDVTDR
jgi:hypothetical protein